MADQEQHNMEVRMEIDELKGSITKLTEMMQVLIARDAEPQRTVVAEVSEAVEDPIPVQRPPSTWPEFGLPPGYTPPFANTLGVGLSAQQIAPIPVVAEQSPIVHTTVQPTFNNPPFVYHVDDSERGDQEHNHEVEEVKEKYNVLEKRLKVVEGNDIFGFDTMNLCLVSDLTVPTKFKVPEFEKYKGHTCPKDHLTMYFRKMAAYANNDKLLVHIFQDSLAGASLKWYMSLKREHIQTWRDLGEAFLKQYKYNMDLAPDRRQLQTMTMRDRETFKVYAQRWRELAAQVEPPLAEKELTGMFMDTLKPVFYEKMIGSISSSFADLVTIGERVEEGLKNGKIVNAAESSNNNQAKRFPGNFQRKKEGEINAVVTSGEETQNPQPYQVPTYPQAPFMPYYQYPHVAAAQHQQPYFPMPSHQQPWNASHQNASQSAPQNAQQSQNRQQNQNRPQKDPPKEPRRIDPIPMTYTELWPALIHKSLIAPRPTKAPTPPFSKGYNPNAKCAFHSGVVGHSIEDCWVLKEKVQDLIESKMLTFRDINPNVVTNPLPH
ncbi:uncharacterized protein LOC131659375 [Vicia villosa]|uniref:uncharacterized protein LOC131659375 n=1 Tax=Vicia villosa TaxID=3911 RepID=UPI00273CA7F6|nr:uncharacterized protein LOC131659375 [Vicia villosa]